MTPPLWLRPRRIINRSTTIAPVASPAIAIVGSTTSSLSIGLSWAGSVAFISMTLQRSSVGPNGPWTTINVFVNPNPPTYTDNGLVQNTQYWYQAFVTAFAVGNSTPAVTTGTTLKQGNKVNWFPGHYAGSNSFIFSAGGGQTSNGAINNFELSAIQPFNRVIGYKMYITWGALEQQQGVYDFSSITNTLAALTAMTNSVTPEGKHLIVCIMSGSFSNPDIPQYIYTNPGVYGPASVGGQGGFWNACAAIYRPNVLARWNALWQAVLDQFGGNLNFEGVLFQEDSFWASVLQAAPDWDGSGQTFEQTMVAFATAVVPHAATTNFAIQATFEITSAQSFALEPALINLRVIPAETDTYGYSDPKRPNNNFAPYNNGQGWPWGPSVYLGGQGGTDYRPITGFFNDVEPPDMGATYGGVNASDSNLGGYTAADILQSINLSYKGSHPTWAITGAGDNMGGAASGSLKTQLQANVWGSLGSGQLGDFLNNPANAITNLAYPANYP